MFLGKLSWFTLVICALDFTSAINHESFKREVQKTNNLVGNWSPSNELPEGWVLKPWLSDDVKLGQVTGVSVDQNENVYIFHRADRVWMASTFSIDDVYNDRSLGPILEPTVLVVHRNGTILKKWGVSMFYLPHGITVDFDGNIWVTDVALHQVLKFPPFSQVEGSSPLLVFGEEFVPGRDSRHFCKPTSVAVARNGDFFVADGYCNSRILKFSASGTKILEWGRSTVNGATRQPEPGELDIPHAITLAEDLGQVCVADRQNGRVQCFHMNNGSYVMEMSSPIIGGRLFSVTYTPAKGGLFFLVNGPQWGQTTVPAKGFVISTSGSFISRFGLNSQSPHDIAVSPDGTNVYVVEIGPNKAWKFVHNGSVTHVETEPIHSEISNVSNKSSLGGLAGAVLITGACFIFAAAIITAAFVYSRSKKAGCGHCSSNRWLLSNGSAEGFKLGNILGHQGFEKLNTGEESDEEQPLA